MINDEASTRCVYIRPITTFLHLVLYNARAPLVRFVVNFLCTSRSTNTQQMQPMEFERNQTRVMTEQIRKKSASVFLPAALQ